MKKHTVRTSFRVPCSSSSDADEPVRVPDADDCDDCDEDCDDCDDDCDTDQEEREEDEE